MSEKRLSTGRYWDKPWSLVTSCTKCSEGCRSCWALAMEHRFHREGPVTPRWDRLEIPPKVKKPTVWAVWNDLFHEDVPMDFIGRALGLARSLSFHTLLFLTKRPERMKEALLAFDMTGECNGISCNHLWFGVTAENQEQADKRIPILLQTPAAHRWVSVEPMLGPVNLHLSGSQTDTVWRRIHGGNYQREFIDAVILGGESGSGARPMHPDWAREVRDDCKAAGVPFYFKQWGEWAPHKRLAREGTYTGAGIFLRPDGSLGCQGDWWEGKAQAMDKVGHKKAGRLLDGREWNELPWGSAT